MGGVNGIFLVLHDITKSIRKIIAKKLQINTASAVWKTFTKIGTFLLVDYTWIYFRAGGFNVALSMQKHILTDFQIQYIFGSQFREALNGNLLIILISIIVIILIDYLQYKKVDWKNYILNQHFLFRWTIYILTLFVIFIFGAYGAGNEQTQFIYFQF